MNLGRNLWPVGVGEVNHEAFQIGPLAGNEQFASPKRFGITLDHPMHDGPRGLFDLVHPTRVADLADSIDRYVSRLRVWPLSGHFALLTGKGFGACVSA